MEQLLAGNITAVADAAAYLLPTHESRIADLEADAAFNGVRYTYHSGSLSTASPPNRIPWPAEADFNEGGWALTPDGFGVIVPAGITRVHIDAATHWRGEGNGMEIRLNGVGVAGTNNATGRRSCLCTGVLSVAEGDVIAVIGISKFGLQTGLVGSTHVGTWLSIEKTS